MLPASASQIQVAPSRFRAYSRYLISRYSANLVCLFLVWRCFGEQSFVPEMRASRACWVSDYSLSKGKVTCKTVGREH